MFRRLWRSSIWHPDSIPRAERKYAGPLKRALFPAYDVTVILLGMLGLMAGFQATRAAFPSPGPTVLYTVLAAAGVVCLVGCAFPRLWVAEITGKVVILITLATVLITMLVAAATLPGHSGLTVAPILIVMMLVPALRLWILGVEIAGRRAAREAARKGAAWSG